MSSSRSSSPKSPDFESQEPRTSSSSPVQRAFVSLKRLMSGDSGKPYDKRGLEEEIQKNLENTRNLEQCKDALSQSYSDLVDMDVKLFTTRAKFNRYLQENVNRLVQDLIKENTEYQATIRLLEQENDQLRKQLFHKTPAMSELDELVRSIQSGSSK